MVYYYFPQTWLLIYTDVLSNLSRNVKYFGALLFLPYINSDKLPHNEWINECMGEWTVNNFKFQNINSCAKKFSKMWNFLWNNDGWPLNRITLQIIFKALMNSLASRTKYNFIIKTFCIIKEFSVQEYCTIAYSQF